MRKDNVCFDVGRDLVRLRGQFAKAIAAIRDIDDIDLGDMEGLCTAKQIAREALKELKE